MPTDTGLCVAVAVPSHVYVAGYYNQVDLTAVPSGVASITDSGEVAATIVFDLVSQQNITVTNPYSLIGWPITLIEGPVTNPIITNVTAGKTLKWNDYVIDSGSTLIVDHRLRQVMLQVGVADPVYDAGSWPNIAEFFGLLSGDNELQVGGSGISGNMTMTVTYRYT